MLLIECGNIKKYFGDRLILDVENFKAYSEDRIGVVGLNGMGKTTFINILCGRLDPDEGWVKSYGSLSYISQLEEIENEEVNRELASKFGVEDTWKDHMSGGEKTRFKLAQSLDKNSQIIFADEPTSNLDMEAVQFLEERFKSYQGALVIISHDRQFLDNLCNKILEIENGKIKVYHGNYSYYKNQKEAERQRAQFEYEEYEREKSRLEAAMEETKQKVKSMKKAPSRMGNSEARLHKMGNQKAKANLDGAVKNMQARLDHLEAKERPKNLEKIKLDALSTGKTHSKVLISGKNIQKAFEGKEIFKNADFSIYNGSKTALMGPNGSGKSTLINLIMNGDNSIKVSGTVKVGYFSQSLDILDENKSIIENVMETSIYNETFARILLSRLLFKREDIYKKIRVLSGGERVKASFAKIFLQDINLLILDEPTNYLDIYSMEALEDALKDYEQTILFVSHDRRFVSSVADQVIFIENKKLISFQGSYEEFLEKRNKKTDTSKEEKEKRIMVLQNRLSELIGRLSMPSKKDDVAQLDKEYKDVLAELKVLKNA
jgi:macrolide transport system ATP-binding/permease protein